MVRVSEEQAAAKEALERAVGAEGFEGDKSQQIEALQKAIRQALDAKFQGPELNHAQAMFITPVRGSHRVLHD